MTTEQSLQDGPIAIGNGPTQKRFIERHRMFLEEYPKLYDVYSKLFIRAIDQPSESERKYLLQLPDTDPAVMAFEDKWTANNLIFFLGRGSGRFWTGFDARREWGGVRSVHSFAGHVRTSSNRPIFSKEAF